MTLQPDDQRPATDLTGAWRANAGMKRHEDSQPGRRPPESVIVLAASGWATKDFPADRPNLWDARRVEEDRHRDFEPTWKPNRVLGHQRTMVPVRHAYLVAAP